jgi:hypothetical protein
VEAKATAGPRKCGFTFFLVPGYLTTRFSKLLQSLFQVKEMYMFDLKLVPSKIYSFHISVHSLSNSDTHNTGTFYLHYTLSYA